MPSQTILSLLLCLSLAAKLSLAQEVNPSREAPGLWSKSKARDWFELQPWMVGCNYIPSDAVNQLEMWQAETFNLDTIDRELGYAEKLGFNSVRVFLHDMLWLQDGPGLLQRIDEFLALADKHHIRVMLVLFDSCWNPAPKLGKQPDPQPSLYNSGWVQSPGYSVLKDPIAYPHLKEYVIGIIERFAEDPRIIAWDVWNEPDNTDAGASSRPGMEPGNKSTLVNAILPDAFAWARSAKPKQPLTSAIWRQADNISSFGATKSIQLANCDIVSFHCYGDHVMMQKCIDRLATFERPMLCTEFLARTNKSVFDPHLAIMKTNKVGAFCWGFVRGKTQSIYPWDSWKQKYRSEPKVWFQDVLDRDGKPYSDAEVAYIRSLTGTP